MAKVVILGAVGKSVSMDVDRFHSGGETIFAKSAHMEFGGKGFNRAVASARQGVETVFIAACGACDADGIGALFRSVPQMLKQRFAVTTLEFEYVKYELEDVAPYMTNDVLYYEHLRESGLNRVDGRPRYTVTELFGVHEPCTLGADFSPLENAEGLSMRERQLETGRAQLKLLRTYLDRLKDAGTYDRTTVIMIADHGRENRFYPVCLVKEANPAEDGFRVDHTPLSLQEDYPDLIDALTSGESFSGFAALRCSCQTGTTEIHTVTPTGIGYQTAGTGRVGADILRIGAYPFGLVELRHKLVVGIDLHVLFAECSVCHLVHDVVRSGQHIIDTSVAIGIEVRQEECTVYQLIVST